MIELENASTYGSRGRIALGPVTLTLDKGAHALVGPNAEGGPLLLAALAGERRLRTGKALTLGVPAMPRPDVAWVPLDAPLPARLTVSEVVAIAAALRPSPERRPDGTLERFGLTPLARRRVATLSREEARTLALAVALSSPASVLLLEEPLARLDARAAPAIVEAIRRRAHGGACVLVATASERDALALGATIYVVRGGLCVKREPMRTHDFSELVGLRVLGPNLEPLAEALAQGAFAQSTTWDGRALVVRGEDGASLASELSRAIASAGVPVDVLEPISRPRAPLVSTRPPPRPPADAEPAPEVEP